MKSQSKILLALAATTLSFMLFGIVSCTPCPNCSPVLTCTHAGCGSAQASSKEEEDDDCEDGGEPVALVSHHRPCTVNSDCDPATGPGAGFACTVLTGTCDRTSGRCVLKLAQRDRQCAEGSVRKCVTTTGETGVIACDPSTCNWANPSDPEKGCRKCGGNGEPCCLGGCAVGLRCSDFTGSIDATCRKAMP